ncbi:hypothetical protein L861_16440 [Litchfieldella anticariensis FP35 = DSM 16096]|uniref:Uncharacterized protein n=1 Tax=Litchfieldella anticariensis (strain DSM 16096 / CECT 5854 / CIP 108499 / LMG 22089 / FP35) TaxID=1121939 RepID=S2LA63_LITA3|nr:hypothetical protein [Halomonas anticariensis]EPC01606.1 hypothetical protein L861_16440 [Halomonas anticariensis FP35 = DSM 16096]
MTPDISEPRIKLHSNAVATISRDEGALVLAAVVTPCPYNEDASWCTFDIFGDMARAGKKWRRLSGDCQESTQSGHAGKGRKHVHRYYTAWL